MNNIIILDPSCVDDSRTHHMNSVYGHLKTFIASNYKVILGTNVNCNIRENDIKNNPIFQYTIYDDVRVKKHRAIWRYLRYPYYFFLKHNTQKVIKDLIQNENLDATDHILIPTTDWIIFQSLIHISDHIKPMPHLHFIIMYEDANWMTGGYPYKKIIKSLLNTGKLQDTIHVYTETKQHAINLSHHLKCTLQNYPYPAFTPERPAKSQKNTDTIYIGALGGGRKDKGFSRLPNIVQYFNDHYKGSKKVRFLIQEPRQEDLLDKELNTLKLIGNVDLLGNHLAKDSYYEYLLLCSAVIFPYSDTYFSRGSGVVNEAVASGIPIICSAMTSLSEAITHNNGSTVNSDDDFVISIINIIENEKAYRSNAIKAKDSYFQALYNNPVIRTISAKCISNAE